MKGARGPFAAIKVVKSCGFRLHPKYRWLKDITKCLPFSTSFSCVEWPNVFLIFMNTWSKLFQLLLFVIQRGEEVKDRRKKYIQFTSVFNSDLSETIGTFPYYWEKHQTWLQFYCALLGTQQIKCESFYMNLLWQRDSYMMNMFSVTVFCLSVF